MKTNKLVEIELKIELKIETATTRILRRLDHFLLP